MTSVSTPGHPWPSVAVLLAISAAALFVFALRNADLPGGLPQGASRLVVLALVLALAGVMLAQTLALRRAKTRLRALEVGSGPEREYDTESGSESDERARRRSELSVAWLESVLCAASRISIIATDPGGVIQVFNSGAEHMLGYTAGEVIGRFTPADLHLASEVAAHERALSERLNRTVQGFEAFVGLALAGGPGAYDARDWTYVRKDGRHVPVHLTVTGVYSPAGELVGFLGVAVDQTERKALEAGLRQAQASVDNAQDMIFWSRVEDGTYAYVNAAASRLLGYSRGELLGMSVFDLNPARTKENWAETVQRLNTHERCVWRGEIRRKDGSLLPVELNVSGIRHEGADYALSVVRDISERRELEASLRQAQLSVDRAEDMILWARLSDKTLRYVNEAVCRSLGYSRAELLGMDARVVNQQRDDENWAEMGRTLRQGGGITYEAIYRRKDGSLFPVENKASLIEHEGVEYAVGIARDITTRRQAEERLKAEVLLNHSLAQVARALIAVEPDMEAIASALLHRAQEVTGSSHGFVSVVDQRTGNLIPHSMTALAPDGQCALDATPQVFRVNPDGTYPGLWGHSLNILKGFYDNDLAANRLARGLPPGHLPLHQFLSVPVMVKGRIVGLVALANPDRDYNDEDLAAVEALADLFALGTEQIRSRQALQAAKEAAEASSRAKGEFLSNMTHEVRTPLNGVLGMLQVLQASSLDPEQRESASIARESAERLLLLLTNVLEFARLDSALAEAPECLSFPPSVLLQALDAVVGPKARAKGLDYASLVEPGLPEFVRSDPAALRQCLELLLDNAVKFTASGEVRLSAGPGQGLDGQPCVAFRVEDTGIGLPQDTGGALFEAFAQADASITRTHGGAGLGLAIARRQARRLGGDITAQARPGGGTVMTLTVLADCITRTPS